VLFLDAGAVSALIFMQSAKSQNYHPKYGLNTGSDPALLAGNFDASTFAGSYGVGWSRRRRGHGRHAPKRCPDALPEDHEGCRQVAKSVDDQLVQFNMCTSFFFLQATLNAAAGPSASAVAQALGKLPEVPAASAASLGDGYAIGKPWASSTTRARPTGPTAGAFRYLGGLRPV